MNVTCEPILGKSRIDVTSVTTNHHGMAILSVILCDFILERNHISVHSVHIEQHTSTILKFTSEVILERRCANVCSVITKLSILVIYAGV